MARKTIAVAELVDIVNGICKLSAPEHRAIRQGAINLLDTVLHTTGNYKGFRYLITGECEGAPGVTYVGDKLPDYPERFEGTDPTRVQY